MGVSVRQDGPISRIEIAGCLADRCGDAELGAVVREQLARGQRSLLLDLRDVVAADFSAHLVRAAASRVKDRVDPRLESGKFAIIAKRDFLFGMARMYQILRDESPVEVRVFRDRGEAELWLGIADDDPPPGG